MTKRKATNRLKWAKLVVPPELADLFFMVAKAHGYSHDNAYLFLYHLLKTVYPHDVEQLTDYLNARQHDRAPPPAED